MHVPIRHQSNLPYLEISLILTAIILITSGVGWFFYAKAHYQQRMYPGVYIDNVNVSGKTQSEVKDLLQQMSGQTVPQTITIQVGTVSVSSSAAQLEISKDNNTAIDQAFTIGHKPYLSDGVSRLLFSNPPKINITTQTTANTTKLMELISELKKKEEQPPVMPVATLGTSGKVATLKISEGKDGEVINEETALSRINEALSQNQDLVLLETVSVPGKLTPDQMKVATDRASKFVGKKVLFTADQITETINDQKIISLLSFPDGLNTTAISDLAATWNKEINRLPQNAVLEYDKETLKVKTFVPPLNGLTIHEDDLQKLLSSTLTDLETTTETEKTVPIAVKETPPDISLSSTNDLGINEQIGFGDSEYFHSIPGRIHNVDITASRINNTIVKAGAEFSFNKTLGEVSAATGYAPAYVIKNGHTELGDGGGVCQVSTTLFRALLNAGLPITKRIAHSYRVSYYELNSKPGIDATVYAGEVDLRFINDTGHDILIRTENTPKNLYLAVKIYGTTDGRTTQIVNHKTWDAVPAPPTLYQDDPTLPKGTKKQIDFAAGGIKASFMNIVKDKDGKIIRQDTYYSNYKAWQAVYLVGTG